MVMTGVCEFPPDPPCNSSREGVMYKLQYDIMNTMMVSGGGGRGVHYRQQFQQHWTLVSPSSLPPPQLGPLSGVQKVDWKGGL